MTTAEFQQIKNRIAKEQENAMKAEGALERIRQQLKQDFDIETEEQIQEKLTEYEEKLEKLNNRFNELTQKLESSVDWNTI